MEIYFFKLIKAYVEDDESDAEKIFLVDQVVAINDLVKINGNTKVEEVSYYVLFVHVLYGHKEKKRFLFLLKPLDSS